MVSSSDRQASFLRDNPFPKTDVLLIRQGRWFEAFNAAQDSDTARGTALTSALSACQSGDTLRVMSPGTYDIGTGVIDLSLGGTGYVNLFGTGRYTTTISSAQTGGGANFTAAILCPGTGSEVADLSVLGNLTNGDYQAIVGCHSNTQSAFTGAVFRNCRFTGQSDSFYINHTTACTGKFYDCEFLANFDAVLLSSATGHIFQFWNCYFNATGPNTSASQPGRCRAIRVQQGLLQLFGGDVRCINGGATDNKAVNTIGANATVEIYGGVQITSTNTGAATAYDIFNQSGTVKVGAGVVYDAAKTSGTITKMSVYGVVPTSGGLTTLST